MVFLKRKFIKYIYLTFIFIPSFFALFPLNPNIEVGKEMYIQHNENNETIFDIQKSGNKTTTVYKLIIPEFEANKLWLTNGTRTDNIIDTPHGATYREKYIPVKPGEEYFFKLYGQGQISANGTILKVAPVLLLNDKDEYVKDYFMGNFSKSKSGVELVVPEGATRMHITNYNNQGLTVQKILHLTDKEIDNLPIQKDKIINQINTMYSNYVKNPVVYQKLDKAFIIFVNDDSRPGLDQFVDLFIKKDVPFNLATIPSSLIENASNKKETRLEVVRRLMKSGKGEILCHNGGVLTKENLTNYHEMYKFFIHSKQMFNYYGLETSTIILAGGTGQVVSNEEEEKWASAFYSASDNYGLPPKYKDLCIDSVYYHPRHGLSNFKNDTEKFKEAIETDISNNNFHVYYFHDYSEISEENLSEMLDYVKQKEKEGKLILGTYKQMYEKTAIRENDLINTKKTYYVSSKGTSEQGLSQNDPMNYETLGKKTFISGDKILLKKGDTFYGTFNIKVSKVDEQKVTVSSYGSSTSDANNFPTISAYKIVNKKESWEKHSDNIYKVNLTNTNNYEGLKAIIDKAGAIGFIEDKNKKKYYNLKNSLNDLNSTYDFYYDGTYLYLSTNGKNPYEELGELKLATKTNLFIPQSNMIIDGLRLQGTGAHGIVGSSDMENITICNNIIEDIGGSILKDQTRYGNGIEFYEVNVKNIRIYQNIIRNVYDVGFTMQGSKGSGLDVFVTKNIFVLNSQDSEIWQNSQATGVYNYQFEDNISFLQGRGWGYEARPDKYPAAHILFWGYNIPNITERTKINFSKNHVYNPIKLYYISDQVGTDTFFRDQNSIQSDNNYYYMNNDTIVYRYQYNFTTKDEFIQTFNKDHHSVFTLLDKVDDNIVFKATNSLNYKELRRIFVEDAKDNKKGLAPGWIVFIVLISIGVVCGIVYFIYTKKRNAIQNTLLEKQ